MYKIHLYSLEGCPYSMKAEELLSKSKNVKVIKVKYSQREKIKEKNKMNTFPQIFLVKNKNKLKIGGCDSIESILNIINSNNLKEVYMKLKNQLKNWNKKQIFRLLEIFVQKN